MWGQDLKLAKQPQENCASDLTNVKGIYVGQNNKQQQKNYNDKANSILGVHDDVESTNKLLFW